MLNHLIETLYFLLSYTLSILDDGARHVFSFRRAPVCSATFCIPAVTRKTHLLIFFTSPPPFLLSLTLHHPFPLSPITLFPRWLWGRPVWNVIGIIPFSLIASSGEQPCVSHRILTKPLRTHYAHISHRNLLRAELNVCTHAHTACMFVFPSMNAPEPQNRSPFLSHTRQSAPRLH